MDLIDSRGWDATNSGCATQGVEAAGEWRRFSSQVTTKPGCKGLAAHLRLIAKGTGYRPLPQIQLETDEDEEGEEDEEPEGQP